MLAGECCSALTSSAPFSLLPSLPEKFTVFFPKDGPKLVHCFLFLVDAPWIVFAVGWYQKKESSSEDLHLFVSFVFAQNSVLLVQTLPALGFGTLHVGVVNRVSEAMAEQHLNSWGVPVGRQCICNKLHVESCFSFPSPTLLPLIKTPLEGVRRVSSPLGYSGSQNPQGQAVAEGCLLPQLCNPKLLSVTGELPRAACARVM